MIVRSNLNMTYLIELENELSRVKTMSLGQINIRYFSHNLSLILLKLNQNDFYDLQAEYENRHIDSKSSSLNQIKGYVVYIIVTKRIMNHKVFAKLKTHFKRVTLLIECSTKILVKVKNFIKLNYICAIFHTYKSSLMINIY